MLSDTQIERYSRQIVLPQVGATGQQRLLNATIAAAGSGAALEVAATYLAGAGVGHLMLPESESRAAALRIVNSDVTVTATPPWLESAEADLLIACDLPLAVLDRAAATARPLIVAAVAPPLGWIVDAEPGVACAACAARNAAERLAHVEDSPAAFPACASDADRRGFGSMTSGVIGSLLALDAIMRLLRIGPPADGWRLFDARDATFATHPITAACPDCAG